MTADRHCPTCICGRRAPVQGTWEADRSKRRGPGTITWAEHLDAYVAYSGQYGTGQSAERLAQRGGFGYGELINLLGREPTTWQPIGREVPHEKPATHRKLPSGDRDLPIQEFRGLPMMNLLFSEPDSEHIELEWIEVVIDPDDPASAS